MTGARGFIVHGLANTDAVRALAQAMDTHNLNGIETLTLVDAAPEVNAELPVVFDRLLRLRYLAWRRTSASQAPRLEDLQKLVSLTNSRALTFWAEYVLVDTADAIAALESETTPFGAVLRASRVLLGQGIPVRWLIPAHSALVYRLEPLFALAQDEGIDAILLPKDTFLKPEHNVGPKPSFCSDDRLFLWDFLSYRLLGEDAAMAPRPRIAVYQAMCDTLAESRDPSDLAIAQTEVLVARSDDGLAWALREETHFDLSVMTSLIGVEPGNTVAASPLARAGEIAGFLGEGLRALGQCLGGMLSKQPPEPQNLPCVLIVGAYGGEHIGDAAILGGVLLRIHRRYGTTRAIVLSQRPNHTRHLIPMLDTPVALNVESSGQSQARALMPQVDAVVFAGGPLMDLPKQLVRHLYAVSLARRHGKPFIAEGIGAGPFVLWPSEWVGRRLLRMAARISLRTSDDAQVRVVRDLAPEIGCDPAFDYLETRGPSLTRLAEADRRWIEALFEETYDRPIVGVNLRPIRPAFTVGVSSAEREAVTRQAQADFETQLAEGMRQFAAVSDRTPCFVFYPMNPNQFGQSDLHSAYRLKRLLGTSVDFRVWQADPSLDGVIALLRRLDAVISMRFHATIFALSQGCPAIGIDYRVGKRDKVAALLGDFGLSENCGRIDQVTGEWICARLIALLSGRRQDHAAPIRSRVTS